MPAHTFTATGSRHPATDADSWDCEGSCKIIPIPQGSAKVSLPPGDVPRLWPRLTFLKSGVALLNSVTSGKSLHVSCKTGG